MPQIAFTISIVQVDWRGNRISSASRSNEISRIQKVYPILCHIPSSGRIYYITPPIYLDYANCEFYLWQWKICEKSEKLFESFYRALFTNICFPVMELLFQYIPLMTITVLLYFTGFTFYFFNGCLQWIPYIKIWLYVLN